MGNDPSVKVSAAAESLFAPPFAQRRLSPGTQKETGICVKTSRLPFGLPKKKPKRSAENKGESQRRTKKKEFFA